LRQSSGARAPGLPAVRQETALPSGVIRDLVPLTAEDGGVLDGVLCAPEAGCDTAIVLMHPNVSFHHHYALIPLAASGYATLGLDSRFAGNDAALVMEQVVLDLAAGIDHLRQRGYQHVVLVGNSGGGALAAFYQSQAERPTVTAPPSGGPPDLTRAALPPADALIMLNAHRGRAQVLTAWLDPAVADGIDPLARDSGLDMFERRWGPPYQPEFVGRYRAAQEARNRRITRWARKRAGTLSASGVRDEAFLVHRTAADLRFLDLTLDPSDRELGTYRGPDVWAANAAAVGLARFSTLASWLSQWGIDSTNAGAEQSLGACSVPMLFIQGTADQGIFPSDAQALFDAATVEDKELHWVPGGTHYFGGRPDLQRQVFERMTGWLAARGMAPRTRD
jgi:fermentation-respiration switch protein FrsA (DUF1100 family)